VFSLPVHVGAVSAAGASLAGPASLLSALAGSLLHSSGSSSWSSIKLRMGAFQCLFTAPQGFDTRCCSPAGAPQRAVDETFHREERIIIARVTDFV
jgi:hypothetical protein